MLRTFLILSLFVFASIRSDGQVVTECPQNIGFENGTFSGWECYSGNISPTRQNQNTPAQNIVRPAFITVTPTEPVYDRHSIIERGSGNDPFGEFSLDSPNGSDFVVKLANTTTGDRSADRISYTLTVPDDVDTYSIIFSYAVVLNNPFTHEPDEQPKFTAKVYDTGSNSSTSCGSFEFVAPGINDGGLPGFAVSRLSSGNNANVLYKPWSPVLVNLNDYIGRTIRLEFTVNDCGPSGHFGYAYIDFNENCSIPVTGNVTCPGADAITLKALPGFYQYTWFNMDTEQILGNKDSLVISPAPPPGTRIGIELVPYAGLGCTQILSTVISGMAMQVKDPPPKCITEGVDLTDISLKVGNSSDLSYTYWRDPEATMVIFDPKHVRESGIYYVKGRSTSGCFMIQAVQVTVTQPEAIAIIQPASVVYPQTVDLTAAVVRLPGMLYSYWTNPEATIPVKNPVAIRLGGTFYVKATDPGGCSTMASINAEVIINDIIIPNTFTPNGDGINDVFTVLVSSKYAIKVFKIMNRWGETVFATNDITNYWTGFKENSMMPSGVYYWVLEGDDSAQKRFFRSGYVTIIR